MVSATTWSRVSVSTGSSAAYDLPTPRCSQVTTTKACSRPVSARMAPRSVPPGPPARWSSTGRLDAPARGSSAPARARRWARSSARRCCRRPARRPAPRIGRRGWRAARASTARPTATTASDRVSDQAKRPRRRAASGVPMPGGERDADRDAQQQRRDGQQPVTPRPTTRAMMPYVEPRWMASTVGPLAPETRDLERDQERDGRQRAGSTGCPTPALRRGRGPSGPRPRRVPRLRCQGRAATATRPQWLPPGTSRRRTPCRCGGRATPTL